MSSDFKDLLSTFIAHAVEYIVVGAHALAAHGFIRGTNDLEVWVKPSPENAEKVLSALVEFGAPLHDLTRDDLSLPGLVYQIGLPPLRIDILTAIDAIEFESAWTNRMDANVEGVAVPVLSRRDLIRNKRATGRLQDLADVERLEQMPPEK